MTRPTDKGHPAAKSASSSVVIIVDDDAAIRASLDSLFRSIGLETRLFGSPAELLGGPLPDGPGCIVLDVRLPGVSGLDLQGQLTRQGIDFPIIFMTGHGDIPMLDAVTAALERDAQRRTEAAAKEDLRAQYETLTAREREVMGYVTAGLMNKQVAGLIGLSEITVKIHRGNVMRKMQVRSLADLVRKAEALGVSQTRGNTDQT